MNPIKAVGQFFIDSKEELKKVSWPTVEELKDSTIIVILSMLGMAVFVGAIDFLLSKVIEVVIH